MASKTSARRGAAIITLVAALAALAGPGVASAASNKGSAPAPTVTTTVSFDVVASWYEDASWSES